MDTVVIYPGRFHPFHKGHKSVYDTLVKRFGKNRVFIATSNKVDPPKSPFTFEEKRAMIALTGIDPSRVIQVKNPYQATEITDNYDPQNTIALFAVSDKDMAEDPRFSFKPRKDGNSSYYQPAQKDMQGFDKHGYIITVPTLQFNVLGKPMRSASEFRANFARADADTQKQMVTDLFGKYDSKVHNIMTQKINETLVRADEILDKLIEMGADDHYILEACRRVDALVESMQVNELKGNARLVRSPEEIDKRLTFIKPVKGLSNLITPKKPTRLMKRRAYSQMPEEITNFNNEDPMDSVIAIRGIGTMTIPQALDKVAEMSSMIAEIAKSYDAKDVQDNVPYYMNLLKTYNEGIQEAYSELAQQRKRGGTKSRGIDPDITEQNSPERQKQIQQLYKSAGDAWAAGNRLSKNFSMHKKRWRMQNDPQVKQQIQKEDEKGWSDKRRLATYNPDSETYRGAKLPGYSNSKYSDPIDNAQNIDDIADIAIDNNPDSNIDFEKLKKVIADLLPKIDNEKNKKVLQARFGLKPFDKSYTLQQIADAMGVTREVIRQREVKALRQLKDVGRDILLPFIQEDELTEKCWPGYEKKGMKTHYGKRVPNCVKKESK